MAQPDRPQTTISCIKDEIYMPD